LRNPDADALAKLAAGLIDIVAIGRAFVRRSSCLPWRGRRARVNAFSAS